MFTLNDVRKQLVSVRSPGLIQRMLMMLPGMREMRKIMSYPHVKKEIGQQIGVIDSMTAIERRNPRMIDQARRKRIARGAGVQVSVVNQLINMFDAMAPMVKGLNDLRFDDDDFYDDE